MIKTQLTLPGLPKSRGGAREGAGRKTTAPKTKTIRVAEEVAFDCKRLDSAFREGRHRVQPNQLTIAASIYAGTAPLFRQYVEQYDLSENEAAGELIAIALSKYRPATAENQG